MMRLVARTALLALLVAASCGAPRLYEPGPIACGGAQASVPYRVREVLAAQGWQTIGDATDEWLVQRESAAGSALVRLTLEGRAVQLEYVDSWNLGYSNTTGEPQIDPEYNRWMRALEAALEAVLAESGA